MTTLEPPDAHQLGRTTMHVDDPNPIHSESGGILYIPLHQKTARYVH